MYIRYELFQSSTPMERKKIMKPNYDILLCVEQVLLKIMKVDTKNERMYLFEIY